MVARSAAGVVARALARSSDENTTDCCASGTDFFTVAEAALDAGADGLNKRPSQAPRPRRPTERLEELLLQSPLESAGRQTRHPSSHLGMGASVRTAIPDCARSGRTAGAQVETAAL